MPALQYVLRDVKPQGQIIYKAVSMDVRSCTYMSVFQMENKSCTSATAQAGENSEKCNHRKSVHAIVLDPFLSVGEQFSLKSLG